MTRRVASLLIAAVAAATCVSGATAATYVVKGCQASSAFKSPWVASTSPSTHTATGNSCGSTSPDTDGIVSFQGTLWFRDTMPTGVPTEAPGRVGGLTATAPVGATLSHLTYDRTLVSHADRWSIDLLGDASTTPIERCLATTVDDCPVGAPGIVSADLPAGTRTLDLGVYCNITAPCPLSAGPTYEFAIAIYSSEITVEESTPPTVSGALVSASQGWVSASGTVRLQASDTLGIRRLDLQTPGGASVWGRDGTCVDWSMLPCSEPTAGGSVSADVTVPVSELGVSNGTRPLTLVATDGAGNSSSTPLDISVDNLAPTPTLTSGTGDSLDASRTLSWRLPTGGSPIASGTARVCRTPASGAQACFTQNVTTAQSLPVTLAPGDRVTVQLTYSDAVGNTASSDTATLTRPQLRSLGLKVRVRSDIARRKIVVRGSLAAGGAKRIALKLAGTNKAGKRVTSTATVTVGADGTFAQRVSPPPGIAPGRRVKLTLTPEVAAGYKPTIYSHTIKP